MSEYGLPLESPKRWSKNIDRAGHDIAEIGGGISMNFAPPEELFTGNPHEGEKKSWEGLGRSISGRGQRDSSHRRLAVGEFATAEVQQHCLN